jgi:hypothetical protein
MVCVLLLMVDRMPKLVEWAAVNHLERLYARRKRPNPNRPPFRSPRSGSVQQNHCSECGRATSLANSNILGRPHR